jgi:hypothetical protein
VIVRDFTPGMRVTALFNAYGIPIGTRGVVQEPLAASRGRMVYVRFDPEGFTWAMRAKELST